MDARWKEVGAVGCLIFALSVANAAPAPKKFKAPRTEFGHPDLQGIWNYSSDVPLERPPAFADKEFFTREDIAKVNAAKAKSIEQFAKLGVGAHDTAYFDYAARTENLRTSLIVYPTNGRMPKLMPGITQHGDFDGVLQDAKGTHPVRYVTGGIGKDGPEQRGLFERCIGINSLPIMPGIENNFIQIAQNKDYVVVMVEQIHDARVIPLDGRPFLDDRFRSMYGESRGRFEGDTLVIVSKNFNNLTTSFRGAGNSHGKVVTERITLTSNATLRYEATIEDSATFQDKIVVSYPMVKSADRMFEFACHEGNVDMEVMLSGARKQEADQAQSK